MLSGWPRRVDATEKPAKLLDQYCRTLALTVHPDKTIVTEPHA